MTVDRGRVYKAKNGKWGYVVDDTPDPATGKRRQKRRQGFKLEREAKAALEDARRQLASGGSLAGGAQTVAQLIDQWLTVRQDAVRPNTIAAYRNHLQRQVSPRIGALRLEQVTPAVIANMLTELRTKGGKSGQGLSGRTLVHIHKLCCRVFEDAIKWGAMTTNPAAKVPRPRADQHQAKTWSPEDLRRFLNHIENTEHRLRAVWHLAAGTGMRRGELLGLRWSDVDLEAGRLSVNQTLTVADHPISFGPPKSERSRRAIPLAKTTVEQLRAHKARQAADRLRWPGDWPDHDLVFTDEVGAPIHPNVFTRTHKRICAQAGLEPIRVHDLRHSWATMALQQGVPLKVVSEALGHSSITITADLYSHVTEDMARGAVDAVADLLS